MNPTDQPEISTASVAGRDPLLIFSVAYLAYPNFCFLLGWLKPVPGMVTSLLLSVALVHCVRIMPPSQSSKASLPWLLTCGATALAWATLSGIGNVFYAKTDWVVRYAVLHDLVVASWPPAYTTDVSPLILRTTLAYFLPAAQIGKLLGVDSAYRFLLPWTAVGATLFFALLPIRTTARISALAALLAVILFSGMDIVGRLWSGQPWPAYPFHIEWWNGMFQYSSMTTQLFWVPNHALPAWIATALIYRHWNDKTYLPLSILLLALLPLWSPFAALGVFPFAMLHGLRYRRHLTSLRPAMSALCGIAIALTLAITLRYLSLDAATIPSGNALSLARGTGDFVSAYLVFITIEFGLLALLLSTLSPDQKLLALSSAILLALPFLRVGPGNDLVMRASIPALTMLLILVVVFIQSPAAQSLSVKTSLLWAILALGAVTAAHEIWRGLIRPAWHPTQSMIDRSTGRMPPTHYAGRLSASDLASLMRPPGLVPNPDSVQP